MRRLKLMVCNLILIGTLSSCSQAILETVPPKATLVNKIETANPIFTNSPTKIIPSVIPSATVIPSKPLTIFPTLSRDQIEQEITKLLATNGNCTGSCFWGFTPNETQYDHVEQELTKFGGRWDSDTGYTGIYHIAENYIDVKLEVNGEKDQPIESISVRIMGLASPFLTGEEWIPYRPDTILAKFGNPQKIQFDFGSAPEGRASNGMVFLYNDMYISYNGIQKVIAPSFIYHTCPTMPENIESLDIFIGEYDQNNWKGDPRWNDYMIDVEDLTGMTIEDLSKILLNPNQGCIDLDYGKYLSHFGK